MDDAPVTLIFNLYYNKLTRKLKFVAQSIIHMVQLINSNMLPNFSMKTRSISPSFFFFSFSTLHLPHSPPRCKLFLATYLNLGKTKAKDIVLFSPKYMR